MRCFVDYNKSLGYLCRLYSRQEKSVKTDKYKKVISLNFIKGNFKRINKNIVNGYSLKNIISNEEINDNILMYLIRYDLVDTIPYQKDEDKFIKYLRIIGSTKMKDIEKYAKGDKITEDTIKWLREWNISSDKENYQKRMTEAKELGMEQGIKKGKMTIAKKLVGLNEEKDFILNVTGITEKEYEKLISQK